MRILLESAAAQLVRVFQQALVNYRRLVHQLLSEWPEPLAMAKAVGSEDLDSYRRSGDCQVEVLRFYGLRNGMAIYDVGCGSGRTAQALQRAGWEGTYKGHDIIEELVSHLNKSCPGIKAFTHQSLSLLAADASLDLVFHWSVFTHLLPEECYVYLKDIHRGLKPGGTLIFSFLEMSNPAHNNIFLHGVACSESEESYVPHLNTFLHRDWISQWAREIGFTPPVFTDGWEDTHHRALGQSLVSLEKQ
jgi:SAM-dependent methyltransferase